MLVLFIIRVSHPPDGPIRTTRAPMALSKGEIWVKASGVPDTFMIVDVLKR